MSAETLREAARLMRERAECLAPVRWEGSPHGDVHTTDTDWVCDSGSGETAEHIASWHPDVALAVADWLDSTANDVEHVHSPVYNLTSTTVARAVAVANAYLGRTA